MVNPHANEYACKLATLCKSPLPNICILCLLSSINVSVPIVFNLNRRYVKFIFSCLNSKNSIVNTAAQLPSAVVYHISKIIIDFIVKSTK